MALSESMQLGLALLSGRVSPAWRARAARAENIWSQIVGEATPDLPLLMPSAEVAPAYPTMRPMSRQRPGAVEAAQDLIEGLARRRFNRVRDLVDPEAWVLWPGGQVGRFERDALADWAEAQSGRPARIRVGKKRSYTFGELKQVLARGVAEPLDAVLGLSSAIMVSIDLHQPKRLPAPVMLAMALDPAGQWRARNLPFGAPDDAHARSARPSALDDPWIRAADRLVRCVVLGHSARLQSVRNLVTAKLWLRGTLGEFDQLSRMIGQGPHRLQSAEIAFTGSSEVPLREFAARTSKAAVDSIERGAPDILGRKLDRLDPRLIRTEISTYDPGTGETRLAKEAYALAVKIEEASHERHVHRIAALFI